MARIHQQSCGRKQLPLDPLRPQEIRAALNATLDKLGLPHDTRAAVSSIRRPRRSPILTPPDYLEDEAEDSNDVFP